ncbi:MAG: hypothetical protein EOO38_32895 [Cytophagaceae bacterium]|nr:MAG: hypothetical protein EOO38_32895 [Cytophagaceae bacterium]
MEKYDAVVKGVCKQRDDAIEAEKKASHEARSLEIRLRTAERGIEVFKRERDEAYARVPTMMREAKKRDDDPAGTPKSLSSDRLHALAERVKRRLEFALCVQDGATRIKHTMREDERAMFDKLLMSLVHNA